MVADACLLGGFVLSIVGVYLTFGSGPACLAGGVTLFVVGGLHSRRQGQ